MIDTSMRGPEFGSRGIEHHDPVAYVQDALPIDFGVALTPVEATGPDGMTGRKSLAEIVIRDASAAEPVEGVVTRSPSKEIALRPANAVECVDFVDGELVDEESLAVREREAPPEIKAAQTEKTREGLVRTAEKYDQLVRKYDGLWTEFTGILARGVIHDVVGFGSRSSHYKVKWRMDVTNLNPQLEQKQTFMCVEICMDQSSFASTLPAEAWSAIKWLAGGRDMSSNSSIRDVPLLGVMPDKVGRGRYAYNPDRLAEELASVLPEHATRAIVKEHKVADPEAPLGSQVTPPKERVIANPKYMYNYPELPEGLQRVLDNDEFAPYIVEDNRYMLQHQARFSPEVKDWTDPTVFLTDKDIDEALLRKYILFDVVRVEELDALNKLLSRIPLSEVAVDRSFRD